jgi:hypothetical protein
VRSQTDEKGKSIVIDIELLRFDEMIAEFEKTGTVAFSLPDSLQEKAIFVVGTP